MKSDLLKPKTIAPRTCRYPRVHSAGGAQCGLCTASGPRVQVGRRGPRQAGFTLIEVLVTISIISILLGIGAFALSKFQSEARRKQTQSMLNGLKGALTQYQTETLKGPPNHANTGDFNWATINGNLNMSSERFVYAMTTVPSAEKIMLGAVLSGTSQSNSRTFDSKDGDNFNEIYDPWGTPILYRSNNLTWAATPDTGLTGNLGDPKYIVKFPLFASAGPDKEFGTDDDVTTLELE